MSNYFSETPIFKIWIELIDIVVPLFSEVLLAKSFTVGDVVCNRSGVHFFYSKADNLLELFYNQSERKFVCFLRNVNSNEVIKWKNSQFELFANKTFTTKQDLVVNINSWLEILKTDL